jgi:hypothetical protein
MTVFIKLTKIMFWKIFAWVNLVINLPLTVISIFFLMSELKIIDIVVLILNDVPLLMVPFLFAYDEFDFKYLSNATVLKILLFFIVIYNATHIVKEVVIYNFTTICGLILDISLYSLTFLATTTIALYIMKKFKISFFQIFIKQ